MRKTPIRAIAVLFGGVVASLGISTLPAAADSTVLGADRDNTLYETIDGSLSNGAGEHSFTGVTNRGGRRRALIHFDIAAGLPPGSVINAATLILNMSQTISGPTDVSLHRVLLPWGEGASDATGEEGGGAPSTLNDATWIHTFYPFFTWGTAGGDYLSPPSAVNTVDQPGFYGWTGLGVMADVQAWLDAPSSNFGWILVGDESAIASAKRFDTRENLIPSLRPQLYLLYTVPASAAGRVPDGRFLQGTELTILKTPSSDLAISWGASCRASDTDYGLYEGTLPLFYSHEPRLCTTGGLTQATIAPGSGNRYYLVAPRNVDHEGAYGYTSFGGEIPRGISACLPQSVANCP
jgi:hypothetical protein